MELRTHFPSLTKNDIHTRISDEFSIWFREEMVCRSRRGLTQRRLLLRQWLLFLWVSSSPAGASPVETSTPLTVAYILLGTSPSPAAASTLLGTSTPSVAPSTPPATLTPFPQLPYSSLVPIFTPSASSAVRILSKHFSSSSVSPPTPVPSSAPLSDPSSHGVVGSHILILPTADNFNRQSDYAKLIIEIMKAPFVEIYPSFGKDLDRIKNMWYTEFGAKYQELKANTERLHIDIGSPILTDEQLMFEAAGGSNKGYVYGFDSQSAAITVERWGGSSILLPIPSTSSAAAHESFIKRERKFASFMTSIAS
ncbi:hypothetical protein M9H77_25745 [Catharanthus roseus]|uniref:Uncharacterized protein n=1 Tax=Catharanthus roseus TaxID=4058 RepID=A0ACC0A7Q9_CATRO|nr:hypothetical protein M9H77_25745 [Catharanthus roseus]